MNYEKFFESTQLLASLAALSTFVMAWIYCIAAYGFLFGVGLGWLASGILAIAVYGAVWVVAAWILSL